MSRYVDIDFILNETDEFGYENGVLYGLSGNSAPSIDICFCRECKYWSNGDDVYGICFRCPNTRQMKADDFCSYGQKERASDERVDNTDNGQQVFNLAFKEVSNSLVQADALLGVLLGTR